MKATKTTKKENATFKTPHEQKVAAKAEMKAAIAETKKELAADPKPEAKAKAETDAFGGRLGSRMSKINLVVINAGDKGASVSEVVALTGESSSIVSAQLHWIFSAKKLARRVVEKREDGRPTHRYFLLK